MQTPEDGAFEARFQNLADALAALASVMAYPLHIANECEDPRAVRFVAELAAFVFERVDVGFPQLVNELRQERKGGTD